MRMVWNVSARIHAKKMKRTNQWDSGPLEKHVKLNKPPPGLFLPDEVLNEVMTWLPQRFVLINCSLVDRQWRRVVVQEARFSLSFKDWEWIEFSKEPKEIASRIEKMSITCVNHDTLDLYPISSMKLLKELSLREFVFNDNSLKEIGDKSSLEKIETSECPMTWSDMQALASHNRRIAIRGRSFFSRFEKHIEDCLKVLPTITNLEHLHYDCGSVSDECRESFYKCLVNAKHLSGISVTLDEVALKYLPLIQNLTDLNIAGSELDDSSLVDLSNLRQLKKLSFDFARPRYIPITCHLGSVASQLTRLYMQPYGLITKEDWIIIKSSNKLEELVIEQHLPNSFGECEFPHLTRLSVKNCMMDDSSVRLIKEMNSLTSLSISDVFHLSLRSRIRLTFGDLCDMDDEAPYRAWCNLTQLKDLAIEILPTEYGRLSVLSEMPFLTSLSIKCVRDDTLLKRCGQFFDPTRLFKHIASSESITDLTLIEVPLFENSFEYLSNMPQLTKLTISHRYDKIESINPTMRSLRELDLSGVFLTLNGLKSIAAMKNLKTLWVNQKELDKGCEDMIRSMTFLKCVRWCSD